MHVTHRLAEYVHDLRAADLPPESLDAAARCVLDLLAAAAAGVGEPSAAACRAMARSQYGDGAAGIWFTAQRAPAIGAAMCNSAAASVLDLDDGFRIARGHPGASVIPAALAAAAECDSNAAEFLAAVVAGYEVGVRVAAGRRFHSSTGTWTPHAAIAAAARLRKTKPRALANALAIATQCAPVLKGKGGSQFAGLSGSDVKEGIPWGMLEGLTALHVAEAGFTGPEEILDVPTHFEPARIVEGLGGAPLIGGTYFKPYALCRHLHAPLEAFATLLEPHAIGARDIEAVEVHTYAATFDLSNLAEPRTLVDIQFSVPFGIALCAVHGTQALLPVDAAVAEDAAVRALARKVSLHLDPALQARFPAESPARVVVKTAQARFESAVTLPRGDPDRPLGWDELRAKFRTATRRALDAQRQGRVLDAVERLRGGEIAPLREALADG